MDYGYEIYTYFKVPGYIRRIKMLAPTFSWSYYL